MSQTLEILKNSFLTYIVYPIIFLVLFIFANIIIISIYCQIYNVSYIRTFIEVSTVYVGFLMNIVMLIYKVLTIPYEIIKVLMNVFTKFQIIFYFIINVFFGFTSFIYELTSVEI
jgi:hypothetical protein